MGVRQLLFPVALVWGLTACGAKGPAPATSRDADPVKLSFAEVKLYSAEQLGFTLHADGTIEKADGVKLGKITEDGRIVSKGKTLVTLNGDGFVISREGKKTNAKVLPDGTLEIDGKTHRFNADGTLSGGRPGAPTIRAEGLTPAARRATMFFLVAILMPGKASLPPP